MPPYEGREERSLICTHLAALGATMISAGERQAEYCPASSLGKAFTDSWQVATEG